MNTDLRNRVVLPILLPIGILLGIAAFVGSLAFIMLYNPRELSLTFAVVAAAGLMVAFSLANNIDEDEMTVGRRSVVLAVGVLPLLAGVGSSLWAVNGGVPEEEWMINIEPHLIVPATAQVGAQNSQSFCVVNEAHDACVEDSSELTLPAQPDAGVFAFNFYNFEGGVPHNFQIFELADEGGQPAPGAIIFGVAEGADTIIGVDEKTYQAPNDVFTEGSQFYFNCVVHPNMQGVLTIGAPEA